MRPSEVVPLALPVTIPLAPCADQALRKLARATGSKAIACLDGTTLLCERAVMAGLAIPARTAAGGGCRLFEAIGDTLALNLSRSADRELLPALFEAADLDTRDDAAIAARIAASDAVTLLTRGRTLGLAIAAEHERMPSRPRAQVELAPGIPAAHRHGSCDRTAPRVLDLSALWAGPLAGHLLWLAGADVVKVESRTRPDAMRGSDPTFYALLNQGKASVALDFSDSSDRSALLSLITSSDIVIEAARPRALLQLGIDAAQLVRSVPGLVWVTITGHGAQGEPAGWVGFGDDCGVAAGLSTALRAASGRTGFVGDAIADPLTGIFAAVAAWEAWLSRRGGRIGLAMSHVVASCLQEARERSTAELDSSLKAWSASPGQAFPMVRRRPVGSVPALGEHTPSRLRQ